MGLAATILFYCVLAAGSIALSARAEKARRRKMDEFAQGLGLTYHPHTFGATARLAGDFQGFSVDVRFHRGKDSHTAFELSGVRRGFSFGKESWLFRGNEDVQTGDASFDRKVRIEGGEAELLAVLDARTRRLVEELVQKGGSIADGKIRIRRPGASESHVGPTLELMADLGKHLAANRPHVARHLGQRARSDDLPTVRRRALQVLLARFRDRDETRETCEALLRDRDPALRLMSAQALGHAGLAALSAILADASISADLRAEALDHLSRRGDPDSTGPLVREHLRDRDAPVRKTAIEAAGRLRDREALPILLSISGRVEDEQKAAIAAALGRIGDPSAEDVLIRLLEGTHAVRLEAATALGILGSTRAVEPLGKIAGSGLLASDAARAASEAIRAIQSRLSGADKGQLTIAPDGAEGALSIAPRPGAVSLAKK
jgi:hypothetical protein